jgi:hypothetical protein
VYRSFLKRQLTYAFPFLIFVLAWILVIIASQTASSELFEAYFEYDVVFLLAFVSLLPSLFSLLISSNEDSKNSNVYLELPIIIALFASVCWFLSYLFPQEARVTVSKLLGIYPMNLGLADWLAIPSFIGCENDLGCDPFGRGWVYGDGWRLFFFLDNVQASIIFGGIFTGLFMYIASKFLTTSSGPFLAICFATSPAVLFSIERGQTDIALAFFSALILIFHNNNRTNKLRQILCCLFCIALATLKPFFIVIVLGLSIKLIWKLTTVSLGAIAYFASMGFDLERINAARTETLYWPRNLIGIDQIPSLFIKVFRNYHNQIWKGWDPTDYKLSLLVGIIAFAIVFGLSLLLVGKSSFDYSIPSPKELSVVLAFSSLYLITFLSGSQVNYKSWFAFPTIAFIMQQPYKKSLLRFSLVVLCFFGASGVNVWLLRNIGSLILALICARIVWESIFPENYDVRFLKNPSSLFMRNKSSNTRV